jgi:PAS domain S-box-containing protein
MVRDRGIDDVDVRAVFDGSGVPMLVADDERRYVDANAAACDALGRSRDQLIGLRIDDLAADFDSVGVDLVWNRFRREGTLAGQVNLTTPDGGSVSFQYSSVANVGPGRHLTILVQAERRERAHVRLSGREREILARVALGQDGPQIARELVVSPATVRTHIGNAVRKLGANSRAHAVAVALRSGLLDERQLD